MSRPSWDDVWIRVALIVSERGTCPRAKVGTVVVTPDNRVVSVGYNGAPAGLPHCLDVGCAVDESGSCRRAVHAEANALIQAGRDSLDGTLYSTVAPCPSCAELVINSGIRRVVYVSSYRPVAGLLGVDLLLQAGIAVRQYTVGQT